MYSDASTRQLATEILGYIKVNPEKHDQSKFFHGPYVDYFKAPVEKLHACNTTMCVAGTAVFLDAQRTGKKFVNFSSASYNAAILLGLDANESDLIFYEMSNKAALRRLKQIAVGDDSWTEEYVEDDS